MTDHNGASAPIGVPVQLMRTVIPNKSGNGQRLIYILSNGQYLGTIECDFMSVEAARLMANDFTAFILQSTTGIQLAQGPALPPRLKPA